MTKEELEKDLNYQKQARVIAEKAVADLEKENAGLKDRLQLLNLNANIAVRDLNDLLTKAKEFLNEFMRISKASDEDFEHDYSELIGETEQFIKETEK